MALDSDPLNFAGVAPRCTKCGYEKFYEEGTWRCEQCEWGHPQVGGDVSDGVTLDVAADGGAASGTTAEMKKGSELIGTPFIFS